MKRYLAALLVMAMALSPALSHVSVTALEKGQTATATSTAHRMSEDGLFPGTYYFYDNMKPGSPSDPNGDGNPSDGFYSYDGPWSYQRQDQTGWWQASNNNYQGASGSLTSSSIDLSAVSASPLYLTIGVVFNMPSASTKVEVSYNGGGWNELESFSGDSTNYPGNADGAVSRQYDVSSAIGGTLQIRLTYATSGVLPSQGLFMVWPIMVFTNGAPYNTNVILSPAAPASGDDITVQPSADDPDNDTLQYKIEWYRNGELMANLTNETMVPSNMTAKDDIWKCVVTPFDGLLWGAEGWSQVQVGNAPPTAPQVEIQPSDPTTLDDLQCVITSPSTDPDGQNISYLYEWYRDGSLLAGENTPTLSRNFTAKGETISVSVRATDGNSTSEAATDTVLIGNVGPDAPTSISPTSTADLTPLITWHGASDPDGDVLRYSIRIGTSSGTGDIMDWTETWDRNYYQVTDPLAPGTYYVQVRASDMIAYSAIFQDTMVIDAGLNNSQPYPPVDVVPSETKETSVNLSWLPAGDPDGDPLTYNITVIAGNGSIIISDNNITTPWYHMVLAEGTYYIDIWSWDGHLASGKHTHTLRIDPSVNSPPSPPSGLTPTRTTSQNPTLSWTPSTDDELDLIKYYIQIGTEPFSGDIIKWRLVGVNATYKVGTRLDFRTYYVQIRANDGHQYSPVYQAILEVYNTPPTPPRYLKPDSTPSNMPTLTWLPGSDESAITLTYYISIAGSSNGTTVLGWTNTGPVEYYTLEEALLPGTYTVSVMTNDGSMNSTPLEDTINITSGGNWPPEPPRGLRPTATSSHSPVFTWQAARDSDATTPYDVTYRITIGSAPYARDVMDWHDAPATEFNTSGIVDLDLGIYYVTLQAYDGHEYSQMYCQEVKVEEGNHAPYPVEEVQPTISYSTMPVIYWTPTEDPDGDSVSYILNIGLKEGADDILNVSVKDNYYIIPETKALGPAQYYITVYATDGELISDGTAQVMSVQTSAGSTGTGVSHIYPGQAPEGPVRFWWYPLEGATYAVWLGTAPYMDDIISYTPVEEHEYTTPFNLTQGRYYITVQAFLSEGSTPPVSRAVNVTPSATQPPEIPQGSISYSMDEKTLILSWPSAGDGVTYTVLLGTTPYDAMYYDEVESNTASIDCDKQGIDEGNYSVVVIPVINGVVGYPLEGYAVVSFSTGGGGGGTGGGGGGSTVRITTSMDPDNAEITAGEGVNITLRIFNLGQTLVKLMFTQFVYGSDNTTDYNSWLNSSITYMWGADTIAPDGYVPVPPGIEDNIAVQISITNTSSLPAGRYTITFVINDIDGNTVMTRTFNLTVEEAPSDDNQQGGGGGGMQGGLSSMAIALGIVIALIIVGVVVLAGSFRRKGSGGIGGNGDEWIPVSDEEVDEFFDDV